MILGNFKEKKKRQEHIDYFDDYPDMDEDEELTYEDFDDSINMFQYEKLTVDSKGSIKKVPKNQYIREKVIREFEEKQREDLRKKEREERIKKTQERQEREAYSTGKDIIFQHVETLRRKRIQKIIKDDYGNVFDEKWEQEKEYFFQNVMKKDKTRSFLYEKTKYLIDKILDEYDENASSEYSENMSPYDYEHYCASILNENGWQAQATQGSGDQGVDVVATKNGHKIAIQCKKYSSPVGNKAVQEVFSAKSHVGADHAIVVTNHSYTKSAKELASTTGVLLLHHDELKKLPF